MRKFSTCFGMMPHCLVEVGADILNHEGHHTRGDFIEACRFGCSIHWCDGSAQTFFTDDETLETTLCNARKYLKEHGGWRIGNLEYTGAKITEEIINKHTKQLPPENTAVDAYKRFLQLKMDCLSRSWICIQPDAMNGAISVSNIAELPEHVRDNGRSELIAYRDRSVLVKMEITVGERYVNDGKWVDIDTAKTTLGLPKDCADTEVVDRIVADIVSSYVHRVDRVRERKDSFSKKFESIVSLFDSAIRACAQNPGQIPDELAVLEAYQFIPWYSSPRQLLLVDENDGFDNHVYLGDAIFLLSTNRQNFDWRTLVLEKRGDLTIGKVKISEEMYYKVRAMVMEREPVEVDLKTRKNKEHNCSVCQDWRITTQDAQWWHVKYGFDSHGNAYLHSVFGPSTVYWDGKNTL